MRIRYVRKGSKGRAVMNRESGNGSGGHPANPRIGVGCVISAKATISLTEEIGDGCKIHDDAYIDNDVILGKNCKIQRGVYIFAGAILEDGVFVGPGTVILNDRLPRAINPDGSLKTRNDWSAAGARIRYGAAIGGGATICPGVTIGIWALIGAGSVVAKDIGGYELAVGNPARAIGFVDRKGDRVPTKPIDGL
jgi:UDP-2-acetamido-3-amino-2,3-dideoxy-glucuronate N-acetyltransferase